MFTVGAEHQRTPDRGIAGLLLAVFRHEGHLSIAGLIGQVLSIGTEVERESHAAAVGSALVGAGFVVVADDIRSIVRLGRDVSDVLAVRAELDALDLVVSKPALSVHTDT